MPRSARRACTSARTCTRRAVSRFENGSSSSSTVGRGARARARATRCCWPPESVPGSGRRARSSPTSSRASAIRAGRSGSRAADPVADVALDGHVREQRPVLEHHADPALLGRHPRAGAGRRLDRRRVTSPASGRSRPAMMRSSVVLPQPDGPSRATTVPGATSRSTSWSTSTAPKRFSIPVTATPVAAMRRRGYRCVTNGCRPRTAAVRRRRYWLCSWYSWVTASPVDHASDSSGRDR